MLLIARNPGQTICIGDDVKVTVLSISRDRVVLGLKAPESVYIVRQEAAEAGWQRKPRPGLAEGAD